MLLNTLIAMMAESFIAVTNESFSNYAFAFGKTLVHMLLTSGVPVPLNLLSTPYNFVRFLWELGKVPSSIRQHLKRAKTIAGELVRRTRFGGMRVFEE